MTTQLLVVNSVDLSKNIVVGSYNVCNTEVYKTYEDANGAEHRRFIRNRMQGSFDVCFATLSEYSTFRAALEAKKSQTDHTVSCTMYDVLSGTTKSVNVFLDYEPTITLNGSMNPRVDTFTIDVEEK